MNTLPLRKDVPVEKTWDLSSIFANQEAWEVEYQAIKQLAEKTSKFQGKIGESSEALLSVLQYRDDLFVRLNKLTVYASMQEDVDTTNTVSQAMNSRAENLAAYVMAAFAFFKAEIMSVNEQQIQAFLQENKELEMYGHDIELLLKQRPHILTETEEALLAQATEALGASAKTFSTLNNADLTFPNIQGEDGENLSLSHGTYMQYMVNPNRKIRESAFRAYYSAYDQLKNTLGTTLAGQIKKDNFLAKAHRFDSARQAALFDNSIPETVYDALVEAVNDRLPLFHRFVGLRKKALKLDTMTMYDIHVPMVDDIELSFTYEEAKKITLEGLAILGEEYQDVLKKAFDERWMDCIENKGKRSGAYSSGTYGTHPFILMNWQDNITILYTLVHELGHSVHSYYTRKNQPAVYGSYSIFLAEVASTTNENLLTDYLLKKYTDKKIQAYILTNYLDRVKSTIYRQTQLAEFEHLIHQADQKGTALTAEFLTEQYGALNRKYYGGDVVYDREIDLEWARIPHFYYNYYVYQYATGFSAASALSAKILTEGKPALAKYLNFLKAGCSDYPIEVLKKAGVDMTSNQPTIDALAVFEARLTELEALLD